MHNIYPCKSIIQFWIQKEDSDLVSSNKNRWFCIRIRNTSLYALWHCKNSKICVCFHLRNIRPTEISINGTFSIFFLVKQKPIFFVQKWWWEELIIHRHLIKFILSILIFLNFCNFLEQSVAPRTTSRLRCWTRRDTASRPTSGPSAVSCTRC